MLEIEIEREREIERVKGAKSNNSLCNAGMPNGSRMMGEAREAQDVAHFGATSQKLCWRQRIESTLSLKSSKCA